MSPANFWKFCIISISCHVAAFAWKSQQAPKIYRQGPIEVELINFQLPKEVGKPRTTRAKVLVKEFEEKIPLEPNKNLSSAKIPIEPKRGLTSQNPATAAGDLATIYTEEMVDIPARLIFEPKISYPAQALRDGVEGNVLVSIVVDSEGSVSEAQITRKAGYGFDEEALRAARKLKFNPAHKKDEHVAVRIVWTCRFRIDN